MVGVGEGDEPPQKRRRTAATASDTGAIPNQNNSPWHWVHGYRGDTGADAYTFDIVELPQTASLPAASPAVNTTTSNKTANAAAHISNYRASSLSNGVTTEYEEGARTSISQQERPSPDFARMFPQPTFDVVHYETPGTIEPHAMTMTATGMPCSSTHATTAASRKSLDVSTRSSAQPGLPSPAPSDENNNNSPTIPDNQLAALRNRSIVTPRPSMDMATGFDPTLYNNMQMPFPQQQQHIRQASFPGQQRQSTRPSNSPAQTQARANSASQQQMHPQQPMQQSQRVPHIHSHRQSSNGINNTQMSNMPSNGQLLPTPPVVPSQQQQPPPLSQQWPASRIPPNVLLVRLANIQTQLGPTLNPTDIGRLALMREAVSRGDWFYQLLSQISCLRSESPTLLPQSIKAVNNSSWDYLGSLLCPNSEVNSELLGFFAEFPEPIMDIYSDRMGAREMFDERAKIVGLFLTKLPQYWDSLVAQCKQMLAPPLVQDMVELLELKSVVLQTTCFRAIARMFWGMQESLGFATLEQVHAIDQTTFFEHGHERNEREKMEAYNALRRVYQAWADVGRRQVQQFPIPEDVRIFFQSCPQSVVALRQQTAALQRQSQRQPQSPAIPQQPASMMLQQRYQQMQRNAQAGPSQPSHHSYTAQSVLQQHHAVMSTLPQGSGRVVSPQAIPNPLLGPPQSRQRRLFPPAGLSRMQPTHPNPITSALHQAPLRSPIPGPASLRQGEPEQPKPRLYRYVVGYGLLPTKVKRRVPVQTLEFSISAKVFSKIAKASAPRHPGEPATRVLEEGMVTYRLRCAVLPPNGYTSEGVWAVADNVWPEEYAFEVNGAALVTRRKLHHGRYLPIDVTSHLKEGKNVLKVFVECIKADRRKTRHSLAVEAVGVMAHSTIVDSLTRLSTKDSLAAIKKILDGNNTVGDDDDVAVTCSSTTIKLFDPYSSSKLVDTPVRGIACLHKDVFDLEIFLQLCKREKEGWPTAVDCWRCPICRGDVRPQTLILDEFLVGVIADLKRQGLMEVKAIAVEADGSWKPKAEERTGVRSQSLERELRARATGNPPPAKKVIEVVELD